MLLAWRSVRTFEPQGKAVAPCNSLLFDQTAHCRIAATCSSYSTYVKFPHKYPSGERTAPFLAGESKKRRCTSTSSFLQLFEVRLIKERYVRKPPNAAWPVHVCTYIYTSRYVYPPYTVFELNFRLCTHSISDQGEL